MSHVTHDWVMSHINESCHIWLSHVTYKWIMIPLMNHHMIHLTNHSFNVSSMYHHIIWLSHVTYVWVISRMTESFPAKKACNSWLFWEHDLQLMSESCHVWLSHVTYKHTYICGKDRTSSRGQSASCHLRISHVTYVWVMSHMNETCHT